MQSLLAVFPPTEKNSTCTFPEKPKRLPQRPCHPPLSPNLTYLKLVHIRAEVYKGCVTCHSVSPDRSAQDRFRESASRKYAMEANLPAANLR